MIGGFDWGGLMLFRIRNNISILDEDGGPDRRKVYPFDDLRPGQGFEVPPDREQKALRAMEWNQRYKQKGERWTWVRDGDGVLLIVRRA